MLINYTYYNNTISIGETVRKVTGKVVPQCCSYTAIPRGNAVHAIHYTGHKAMHDKTAFL